MAPRKPAVAGQFYSADRQQCLAEVIQCLEDRVIETALPEHIVAGIVPHAGYLFSGSLAAMVFSAVRQANGVVDTFILFGAVHRFMGSGAAVYTSGSWLTPLGEIAVDDDLAGHIIDKTGAKADSRAHLGEHSIEVQLPFIQHLFPAAKIVPVAVPPSDTAVEFGTAVGDIVKSLPDKKIVCAASTDLTHYGPRYGFCPQGTGEFGIDWARDVNDMEFISAALQMEPEKMLRSAEENFSACGAGAAAAAVAAAKSLGRKKGALLAHTTSSDIMKTKFNQSGSESVGYAAMVF